MNTELLEALAILEKEKISAKMSCWMPLRIHFSMHVRTISENQTILRSLWIARHVIHSVYAGERQLLKKYITCNEISLEDAEEDQSFFMRSVTSYRSRA